jgi:hypothetical protein
MPNTNGTDDINPRDVFFDLICSQFSYCDVTENLWEMYWAMWGELYINKNTYYVDSLAELIEWEVSNDE